MQGIRSLAAVVAGYGFMASIVMASTILATALFMPGGLAAARGGLVPESVPVLFLVANFATSLMAAVFGGWLTARIGRGAPFAHAVALAVLTAVLAVVSALDRTPSPQPGWYPVAIGVVGVTGVLLGGWLRAAAAAAPGPVVG